MSALITPQERDQYLLSLVDRLVSRVDILLGVTRIDLTISDRNLEVTSWFEHSNSSQHYYSLPSGLSHFLENNTRKVMQLIRQRLEERIYR